MSRDVLESSWELHDGSGEADTKPRSAGGPVDTP
jgi:hypothetical protein